MDVICQAKSGMGKTAVFVLATLQQIEPVDGEVSVVVLCHTRELAFQIRNEYNRFSKYIPDIRTEVFYGGVPTSKDIEILRDKKKCPHILVGTPGRVWGLVRDKYLKLNNVKHFVLDECDKMLEQLGTPYYEESKRTHHRLINLRYASRRPRHFPLYTSPQASHDVLCYSCEGDATYLQEVHAKPS